MSPHSKPRFSKGRVGAAYPLKPDEVLQARAPIQGPSGQWGRYFLRVTQEGWREQAKYHFNADPDFASEVDLLTAETKKEALSALMEFSAIFKGDSPSLDPNDSGRLILFWRDEQPVTAFIANCHPEASPTPFAQAFERLWNIITSRK